MAQYTVDHSCGHQHTHHLTGPMKQREWRLDRLAEEECPACAAAARAQARAAESKAAESKAAAAGLPDLTGSEKQIAWGVVVREKLIASMDAAIRKLSQHPSETVAKLASVYTNGDLAAAAVFADAVQEVDTPTATTFAEILRGVVALVQQETSSKWWIDNRELELRGVPELLAARAKQAEAAAAKRLEWEAGAAARAKVESERERVRGRVGELLPNLSDWSIKVGEWSGCKRVYFNKNGRKLAVLHVTGDRSNSPNSLEVIRGIDDDVTEGVKELLLGLADGWITFQVEESRG